MSAQIIDQLTVSFRHSFVQQEQNGLNPEKTWFLLVRIIGVIGVAGLSVSITHTSSSDADVFDTVVVLQEIKSRQTLITFYEQWVRVKVHAKKAEEGAIKDPAPQSITLNYWLNISLQRGLTLRVTVGSRSALPIRCPKRVLVLRKRSLMLVALVKSLSTGE